jgi:DNA replication and repair protein RecF
VGVDLAVEISPRRKRFTVNEKPQRSFSDYLGSLFAVAFTPSDLTLLQGASSPRRRFLDRVVSGVKPAQLGDLQRYDDVLKSRNRLLKEPVVDSELLSVYTDQMIPLAARIVERRLDVIGSIKSIVQEIFASIFEDDLEICCQYDCRWLPSGEIVASKVTDLEEQLRQRISDQHRAERGAGHTLIGPHRDDLKVSLNGLPARDYASQGQLRSAVLALKLTEIRYFQQVNGHNPVLLLDDVSSELDRRRNAQLFELVREVDGQTFITTTDRSYIQIDSDVRCYDVADGQVTLASG